jgi:uncharacterized protein YeaO (DUF488 family)
MIKIKHFLDAVEKDDGERLWIEPVGLTKDLKSWCKVSHVLSHIGPPRELWEWFDQHPTGYEFFRGRYHEWLGKSSYKRALEQLAKSGRSENFTLLHQGDDSEQNSATALYEYLHELEAWCPPEEK